MLHIRNFVTSIHAMSCQHGSIGYSTGKQTAASTACASSTIEIGGSFTGACSDAVSTSLDAGYESITTGGVPSPTGGGPSSAYTTLADCYDAGDPGW